MKSSNLAWTCIAGLALMPSARADAPQYSIIDLGLVGGATVAAATSISPDGSTVAGLLAGGDPSTAFLWTPTGGMQALPNPAGVPYAQANGVNYSGLAVGTASQTFWGANPMPVMWRNGAVSQLALPADQTNGRANAVNSQGTAVGSVFSAAGVQQAAIYGMSGSSVITAKTSSGAFMSSAYGINDTGLVVGVGSDPTNPAVNLALLYNSNTGAMTSLGALPGGNGALAFGISNAGYVVGTSMSDQGSGQAFIWSARGGMTAIPLTDQTSTSSAHGVNNLGWAVGVGGGAYAVPFLYENGKTYTLASLLPSDTPWDFTTNTTSSADAISDNGIIVGRGIVDGQIHAFEMVPVPEPASWALMLAGLAMVIPGWRRRADRSAGQGA